jgi:DNA-binding beta-propeller fold protein YncE
MLQILPDGSKIYASNWLGNNVSEIDLLSGKLLRNIKTVKTPRGIYLTRDGRYMYVAGYDKGEIQKINLSDDTRKTIFKSGGAMRHFAADPEKGILYISDMGKNVIWKLDLATDIVTQFAKTDSHPNTIALSPDKKILFVSNRGHNFSSTNYYVPGPDWGSVLLFDTATSKTLDAIVAGNQPTALDVSPDGSLLAFSDFLDAKIEVYKVPPYEELLKGNGGRSAIYKSELLKK